MVHPSHTRVFAGAAVLTIALLALGTQLPNWLLFTVTKAAGYGLVALGIVLLMRGGVVSFGQGLVYCGGAYAAGLVASRLGVTDIFVLLTLGALTGIALAGIVAPLIARYRGIFFAMLSMAFSMVLYGILVKSNAIGGSDGFTVPEPTFLFYAPTGFASDYALFAVASILAVALGVLCRLYFDSMHGLITEAIRENELRVEYLGSSAHTITARNFTLAGGLAGMGGVVAGFAVGHMDPLYAFWTTSGEFVFIAILAGRHSVSAVFVAALILELVRSFSNRYFPETWQMILGLFLLIVILFLPQGLGSIGERLFGKRGRRAAMARRDTVTPEAAE
ncbi:MAG: branched-chain amino acid ABC transporter permease [Pseudomonadota bacterium]